MPFWKKDEANLIDRRQAPEFSVIHGDRGVLDGTLPTDKWDLDHMYPGQDLVSISGGSAGKPAPHYLEAIHLQGLENANLAEKIAAFTTLDDLTYVQDRLWTPGDVVRTRTHGSDRFISYLPNRAAMIAGYWETIGNHGGCASDPAFAINVLKTDPLATQSLDRLVDEGVAQLRRHNLVGGCSVLEFIGAGGSYPVGDYLYRRFSREMNINRRHRVLYIGSRWQSQNRRIARAWLSHYLAEPTPSDTVLYLVKLDTPGPQLWDRALACGFLTVTATDRNYGQTDATNNFNKLRERGDIVEVKALVVPVPLRRLEKRGRFGRKEVYSILHGSPVPSLLATLKRQIEAFPCDYRLAVFVGSFHPEEISQLQQRAQVLSPNGQVDVLVNTLKPLTHGHAVADYYLIDFAVPTDQPPSLVDLASDGNPPSNGSNHLFRDHLVEQLAAANGITKPAEVEAAIQDILALPR